MEPSPPRRRPGPLPDASPAAAPPGPPAPRRGPRGADPLRVIVALGLAAVVAVVAVAFATGTADDLPWGAIIGVLVIVVAAAVTSRRRAQRIREAFPDDEDAA